MRRVQLGLWVRFERVIEYLEELAKFSSSRLKQDIMKEKQIQKEMAALTSS